MSEEPLKVYTIKGKLGEGIIQRLINQMKEDGVSDELINHAIENQLIPQLFANIAGDKDAQVRMVSTNLNSAGHLVACHKCGRQAKVQSKPPDGFIATCPQCLLKVKDDA